MHARIIYMYNMIVFYCSKTNTHISPCYLHYIVPPGADDTILAVTLNRTSILVSWLYPVFPQDPLLLRYSLFYVRGEPGLDPTDYSTAQNVSNILPTLRNGSVSQAGIVEYVLSGLETGMEYSISVRASFPGVDAPNSFYVAKSSTYGLGMYMCAVYSLGWTSKRVTYNVHIN